MSDKVLIEAVLTDSSIMAFKEALNGQKGDLDAWLECNDEAEVRAHIKGLLTAQPQASACVTCGEPTRFDKPYCEEHCYELPQASAAQSAPDAPPCWWINHGSHGQITQREDEAQTAADEGKQVVRYTAAWQRAQSAPVVPCWSVNVPREFLEGLRDGRFDLGTIWQRADDLLAAATAQPAAQDQGEVQRLREALEPFAAIADAYDPAEDDDHKVWIDAQSIEHVRLPLRAFRAARATLAASTGQEVKP